MLRVKYRKRYKENSRGDIVEVTNNVAVGLVEHGVLPEEGERYKVPTAQ